MAQIAGDGVRHWELSSGEVHILEAPPGGAKLIAFGADGPVVVQPGNRPAEEVDK